MHHANTVSRPELELERLQELSSLGLNMSDLKDRLQPYVELAKHVTQSPVCEINIIDAYYQWTISGSDDGIKMIPREESVCQDTIHADGIYEITDLKDNQRYKDRFYVKDEPHFRYYCGVQLTTRNNFNVGSLCVLDKKTKQLTDIQKEQMKHLSFAIINLIETDRKQQEISRSLNNLKSDIRKLNHDIRTPINGIVGMAELMEFDGEGSNSGKEKDNQETFEIIKKCAHAVVEKIDGVLENMMGENLEPSGKEIQMTSEAMFSQLVKNLNDLYHPQALKKNIELDIQLKGDFDRPVNKYLSTKILQIVGNLLSNSLKFTPQGGCIDIILDEEEPAKDKDHDTFTIIISDTGKGMSDEQVRAFNERSGEEIKQSSGTEGERSFGIGLRHVQSLAEQLNGSVSVQSQLDKGTTFRVRLPLNPVGLKEVEEIYQPQR